MDGRRLGQLSLRLDAVYCVVLGSVLAVAASRLAPSVALPSGVVFAVGLLVVVWAGLVAWLARVPRQRAALRFVFVANVVAAIAIGALSTSATGLVAAFVLVAVALDVAAFAVSQAIALARQTGTGG